MKFFRGLVMMFKRVSYASKATVFIIKILESNISPEYVRKLLVSLKSELCQT